MPVTRPADIVEAMTSPDWWARWFARGDWSKWHTFLRALFAIPPIANDRQIFLECTGREDWPTVRGTEAYAAVGRRGGKTRIMSTSAAWMAAFEVDWRAYLDPGEYAHVLLLAKDVTQAAVAFGYLASLFLDHPILRKMVRNDTADAITLSNRVIIRVASASFRGLRGYAIPVLIADELAFWFDGETSANPAEEILAAVRPAMLQFRGKGLLLAASSPYRRSGPLFQAYRTHHGKPSPILFWKAATSTMNPLADAGEIARAYDEDPQRAAAEFGGEFRTDVAAYIDREAIEAVTVFGRRELAPQSDRSYVSFTDPSGGSQDSFSLGIAYLDPDTGNAVLAALREVRAPFSPSQVIAEFAELLHRYRVSRVVGDRYGGEFPREQFRHNGIVYEIAEKAKSDLYKECLPLINSAKAELLDNPVLINQFAALERHTGRAGRDVIDHPLGGRDDICNAAAGALVLAAREAAPTLWRHSVIRNENVVAWPVRSIWLMATTAADETGVAVGIWALGANRYPLRRGLDAPFGPDVLLVDYAHEPLDQTLFPGLAQRLQELAAGTVEEVLYGGPVPVAMAAIGIICSRECMPHAMSAGLNLVADGTTMIEQNRDALLMACAAAIGVGKVKVSSLAEERATRLPLPLHLINPGAAPCAGVDMVLMAVGSILEGPARPREWSGISFAA
jgi:hypothetical protein